MHASTRSNDEDLCVKNASREETGTDVDVEVVRVLEVTIKDKVIVIHCVDQRFWWHNSIIETDWLYEEKNSLPTYIISVLIFRNTSDFKEYSRRSHFLFSSQIIIH